MTQTDGKAENQAWHPGKILETSGFYWQTCTLHAGVKLDLFSVLDDETLSASAVAGKAGLDARAAEMLLNALTAMGLLVRGADGFSNTPESARFLSKASPDYMGFMVMHHHHLVSSWNRLEEAVRLGRPVRTSVVVSDDAEARESFLMGMFNNAMLTAPFIVPGIDLSGCGHLLDLGGGPGTYAIHFCQKYPDLKATVFDLPTTAPFARKTVARFGLSDRIEFVGGDYNTEEIPGDYDAAWLSHVLHGESPEECRRIIRKAVSRVRAGGILMIHDFILDDSRDAPLFPALFSLNMLLGTQGGQAYSGAEIAEMMEAAGVREVQRIPVETPGQSGVMTGRV